MPPHLSRCVARLTIRSDDAVTPPKGSVNKVMVDDKGLLVLCALGLPPMRHGDDPFRAVRAAMDIPAAIAMVKGDAQVRVGVSTGRAFCGVVGHSELRREYSVMGPCVNLCARLMMSAAQGSVMVCKESRKAASDAGIEFGDPIVLHLKGIGDREGYVFSFNPSIT
jgi:class 3 adenylate cyclase